MGRSQAGRVTSCVAGRVTAYMARRVVATMTGDDYRTSSWAELGGEVITVPFSGVVGMRAVQQRTLLHKWVQEGSVVATDGA